MITCWALNKLYAVFKSHTANWFPAAAKKLCYIDWLGLEMYNIKLRGPLKMMQSGAFSLHIVVKMLLFDWRTKKHFFPVRQWNMYEYEANFPSWVIAQTF